MTGVKSVPSNWGQLDDGPRHDRGVPDEGTLLSSVLRHDEHVDASAPSMVWH
ncbi:hypothetical protein [Rhodococcus sp. LB1]|uniref:hypothetical protein n=1 Tax=Rhodococcus sp. LB1 TaxID=1807499 RepID=UPI0012E8AD97|nr:hypothetical protein [Rhodococcus sp. LB1]